MRTALECLFCAGAVWNKPERVKWWVNKQEVDTHKQTSEIKRSPEYALLNDQQRAAVDRLSAQPRPEETLDAQRAASDAGLSWLYTHGYRSLGALGAHASARSLNCHFSDLAGLSVLSYAPDLEPVDHMLNLMQVCLETGTKMLLDQLSDPSVLQPIPR
jgi:hypothetical protein